MPSTKLLADSTCDLSQDLITENNISIMPLYVNFGTESFRDNVDIKPADLYRRVKDTGSLPTTSAPTPENYLQEFKKHIDKGMNVIYISLSSKISSSYQNACTAASEFPEGKVKVINSLNLSTGIGLLVLAAADCIRQGWDIERTANLVQEKVGQVDTQFIIDNLEYLHKGGRCTGLQMFFSSLLKIHPVIEVVEGSMRPAAKVRGGRQQVLNYLVNHTLENLKVIDPTRIFITHSEDTEEAQWIKKQLSEKTPLKQIFITDASCVISSHCGPKTVGILYLRK